MNFLLPRMHLLTATGIAVVAAAPCRAAPIELTAGNLTYSQDFDALSATTNNNATTTPWADDSTIPGWWLYQGNNAVNAGAFAGAAYSYNVGDGTLGPQTAPLSAKFYSLGAAAGTDRSLGYSPTTAIGELSAIVYFHNATAGSLKIGNLKFTAEAYRANGTANNKDSIYFWWKVGADMAALQTMTTATSVSNTTDYITAAGAAQNEAATITGYGITGWTRLPEFTYTNSNATGGAVLAPETKLYDAAPSTTVVEVPAGSYLALRWSDINGGGTDAMLGIDDLTVTFIPSGCAITADVVTNVTRLPGADESVATDDSVQFQVSASATNGAPAGWVIPAGGPGAGASSAYDVPATITLPIAAFSGATNAVAPTATIRLEDAVDATCFRSVVITAPSFIQKVTATNSPQIVFTPSANGVAAYYPPAADQSELGWSGGTTGTNTASNVQTQPNGSGGFVGTNKYWHLTTANATFTTNPVDVSAAAGQAVKGQVELSFYSTSTTVLDAGDVVFARLELALDGDFNNAAGGNLLTQTLSELPPGNVAADATAYSAALGCAALYTNLAAAPVAPQNPFPDAAFTFHPFEKSIPVPMGNTRARARIVYGSGAGVSNTEHVLLDNVRFSIDAGAADSDADGMPDAYEIANGLNKDSNADRDTDLDGDGHSNYLEYVAGTAANDATSSLRVVDLVRTATTATVSWSSAPGKVYRIDISPDMTVWTDIGTDFPAAGAPAAQTTAGPLDLSGLGSPPMYFLRVRVK